MATNETRYLTWPGSLESTQDRQPLYIKTVQGDLGKKYHAFESACPITAQGVFTFEFGATVAWEAGCFEVLPVNMTG